MFTVKKKVSIVFGLLLLAWCVSTAWGAENPIRIGVPGPYTGPYAQDGLVAKQAVTFAVEDINSKGGVLGRELKMYYYDVEDVMPEKVMASAESLCRGDKVNLVVTSWVDYGVDVKAYGRYDIPFFTGAASELSLKAYQEDREQNFNYFNYFSTETEMARSWFMMMDLPYEYPNKKVYVINEDDYWSTLIADEYIRFAKESGWEAVGRDKVSVGTVSWGGVLTKIRTSDPAIVMMICLAPNAGASFVKQFRKDPSN